MPVAVLVGLVAVLLAACGLAAFNLLGFYQDEFVLTKDAARQTASSDGESSAPVSVAARSVFVFVSGAVVNPGVYELPESARVVDAVTAAGGFCDDAVTDSVNLARILQDGEQIAIARFVEGDAQTASGAPAGPAQTTAGGLVNINSATESELQSLPGVGESTAKKIIASREKDGPFTSKEDLMRVSGIGEKKFAALEELICV